jgi:outer membrane biosynthesis protein TonB
VSLRALHVAVLAASLTAAPVPAQEKSETLFVNDPARWGRALRIVEPGFPREAAARRIEGHVEVTGRITWAGVMENIEYKSDGAEASLFVKSVADVIAHWRFYPVQGEDCQPQPTPVTARVDFRYDGEKPKVSVTQSAASRANRLPEWKLVHRVEPEYPMSMQRMGWQATVFTRMEIDAPGAVTKVTANGFPKQRGVRLDAFESEVVETLGKWKYSPVSDDRPPRVACYQVDFRFKD